MKKKMGCKADGEDEYRSNLMVVRISSRHPTKQTTFYSPRSPKMAVPMRTIVAPMDAAIL